MSGIFVASVLYERRSVIPSGLRHQKQEIELLHVTPSCARCMQTEFLHGAPTLLERRGVDDSSYLKSKASSQTLAAFGHLNNLFKLQLCL